MRMVRLASSGASTRIHTGPSCADENVCWNTASGGTLVDVVVAPRANGAVVDVVVTSSVAVATGTVTVCVPRSAGALGGAVEGGVTTLGGAPPVVVVTATTGVDVPLRPVRKVAGVDGGPFCIA